MQLTREKAQKNVLELHLRKPILDKDPMDIILNNTAHTKND